MSSMFRSSDSQSLFLPGSWSFRLLPQNVKPDQFGSALVKSGAILFRGFGVKYPSKSSKRPLQEVHPPLRRRKRRLALGFSKVSVGFFQRLPFAGDG